MIRKVIALLLLAPAVTAFLIPIRPTISAVRSSQLTVSAAKKMVVVDKATACLEGECSIEDVDDLIVELKKDISRREEELKQLKKYQTLLVEMNAAPKRDGMEEMVRNVLEALTVEHAGEDFPNVPSASGFTGESWKASKQEKGWVDVPYAKVEKKN